MAISKNAPKFWWATLSDEELLDLKISSLGLEIEGTTIEECVADLLDDLEKRGIRFRPHFWLSADWFSPNNIPGVAIPFYLAHPRLVTLERHQMSEVEGGTRSECVKILRHETGHAIQHAYQLQRQARWQHVFGRSSQKYPAVYRPNPASRRYVQHLRLYYAQSHPVEDFAETFAVWLQPKRQWRKKYAGWPALKKLEFVDALMETLEDEQPSIRSKKRVEPVREIRSTLGQYYAAKREQYLREFPDIYDEDLHRLFSDDPKNAHREMASSFLRRNRPAIRRLVSTWTGEYQFTMEQVYNDISGRCREQRLRVAGSERVLILNFAILLTVKTLEFHYRRRLSMAL